MRVLVLGASACVLVLVHVRHVASDRRVANDNLTNSAHDLSSRTQLTNSAHELSSLSTLTSKLRLTGELRTTRCLHLPWFRTHDWGKQRPCMSFFPNWSLPLPASLCVTAASKFTAAARELVPTAFFEASKPSPTLLEAERARLALLRLQDKCTRALHTNGRPHVYVGRCMAVAGGYGRQHRSNASSTRRTRGQRASARRSLAHTLMEFGRMDTTAGSCR